MFETSLIAKRRSPSQDRFEETRAGVQVGYENGRQWRKEKKTARPSLGVEGTELARLSRENSRYGFH